MGRGRAKAKQQKVARELKYSSHHTDLDALQRELRRSSAPATDTYDYERSADGADGLAHNSDELDEFDEDEDRPNGA